MRVKDGKTTPPEPYTDATLLSTMEHAGRSSGRFQEPFNEKIASVLCSRLLDEGDYVAYELEDGGFMKWTSRCKPMTDQVTEFVPAWALLCSCLLYTSRCV